MNFPPHFVLFVSERTRWTEFTYQNRRSPGVTLAQNLLRCEMDRFNKAVTTLRILRRLLELLEQRDSAFVIRKYPVEMYLELNTFIRRTYLSRWRSNSCWNRIGGWEIVFKIEYSFFFEIGSILNYWIAWIIFVEGNITVSRFDWLQYWKICEFVQCSFW